MQVVGERYENNEYFIPELVMSGEILNQITEIVKEKSSGGEHQEEDCCGKVLIGTVDGDVHDIGKNIVTFMLDVNGFKVKDIGVDIPVDDFVEAVEEFEPDIVGMSGLLTLAYDSMEDTIEAFKEAGLRDEIKIMIGGGCMDEDSADHVGADAYGESASEAVKLAKQWIGGIK
jgi:5-methyltetrahydrofolate--homocysteine methyltransferase